MKLVDKVSKDRRLSWNRKGGLVLTAMKRACARATCSSTGAGLTDDLFVDLGWSRREDRFTRHRGTVVLQVDDATNELGVDSGIHESTKEGHCFRCLHRRNLCACRDLTWRFRLRRNQHGTPPTGSVLAPALAELPATCTQ